MKTFDELMRAVNCSKFPDRWREIYGAAMSDYYKNGCELTNPAYYDELANTYGILNTYRDVYKKAAAEVGKSPDLSAFLALLCYAIKDRKTAESDFMNFSAPVSPDGKNSLAYDMLSALAVCAAIPSCYETLKKRNLPQNIIYIMLNDPETYIDEFMRRNNGAYGSSLIGWAQLILNGKIFRLNRLNFEIFSTFTAKAAVFKSIDGEEICLADGATLHKSGYLLGAKGFEDEAGSWQASIEETRDFWHGFAYDKRGYVCNKKVSLPKSKWEKVLSHGDPVISVHIPFGGSLSAEAVNSSISEAREFVETYFPDFPYKAFTCHSWMLNPELENLIGAESNIVKFGNRFNRISAKCTAEDVFYFIFLKPWGTKVELSELSENTRLEKSLKSHYLSGNFVHELYGYFLR